MLEFLKIAIEAALAAGSEIMAIYTGGNFETEVKKDTSPLTIADKRANEVINNCLKQTAIPIISEENNEIEYSERKHWKQCWIVDPLDGTKEFIKKNDEFTVNIALTVNGSPELGVIYAPALELLYFSVVSEKKAFKVSVASIQQDVRKDTEELIKIATELRPSKVNHCLKIVGSRSHLNEETISLFEKLQKEHSEIEIISKGSSLKFCLLAEGAAHYYPRLGPTMEWDTAAGQAICEAVGFKCNFVETGKPVTYNRQRLLNGHFIVSNEGQVL